MSVTARRLLTAITTTVADAYGRARWLFSVGLIVLVLTLLFVPAKRARGPGTEAHVRLSPIDADEFEKALVARYEQRFDALQTQFDAQRQDVQQRFDRTTQEIATLRDDMTRGFTDLQQALTARPPPMQPAAPPPQAHAPALRHVAAAQQNGKPQRQRSQRRADRPDAPASPPFVQLPAGSFVPGTILTGVYAPADHSRPLPLLFSLDAGFTGPNGAQVPLDGCFVLGKAAADLGAERATIQLATLSCVLPSGETFERDIHGYVRGPDGDFGVRGMIVRHDAAKIGMAALTGFLAGAGDALSRAESTTIVSPTTGSTITAVTGDSAKFAAFAGLANTANELARYYLHLARQITPAVWIAADQDVHLVMQKGVTIEGLVADDLQVEPVRYARRRR